MSLEMFLALLGIALLAAYGYRGRLIQSITPKTAMTFTAASITTIEAAFLRAGRSGVAEVRAAAERCGAEFADVDLSALEAGLAARGLAFDAASQRKVRRARLAGNVLALPAVVATTLQDAGRGAWSPHTAVVAAIEFAILWGGAALAIRAVTHIGSSTTLGRQALAMRRAAYPLSLLREAYPTTAVAHYGGAVRRCTKRTPEVDGGGDDGGYVWVADAGGGGGHDGSSGHGSHSCASSCGSGGCGGH